ncbi:type IV pilus biogenesis/stability protein PilW [Marinospirillum sp. MEB164]|uniref:Type IV pilus biogenesis/stability protein PilW n=1 Tax=Marinospirillum alkalitolerans TaxID=3123374 RepID=A0ABW8PXE1_9GAMM
MQQHQGMIPRFLCLGLLLVLLSACAGRPAWEEVDPQRQAQAYTNLGFGLFSEGDYQRALREFNRALQVRPHFAEAHHGMALTLQAQGEDQAAESHFRQALRHDPQMTAARNNYAAFLFAQSRYDEARIQLELASQDLLYEQRWLVFENLGFLALEMDNKSQARHDFERALRLNPGRRATRIRLFELLMEAEAYSAAQAQWRSLQEDPNLDPQVIRLGITLAQYTGDQREEQRLWQQLRLAAEDRD